MTWRRHVTKRGDIFGGGPYRTAGTPLDLHVPALTARALRWGCREPLDDLRYAVGTTWPREALDRWHRAPAVARLEAYGRERCGDPVWVEAPGQGRYATHPTSAGGWVLLPGGVGMEDVGDDFAPPGRTLGDAYLTAIPGKSFVAWGLPDLTTGGVKSGWRRYLTAAGGDLVTESVAADGTATEKARISPTSYAFQPVGSVTGGVNDALTGTTAWTSLGTVSISTASLSVGSVIRVTLYAAFTRTGAGNYDVRLLLDSVAVDETTILNETTDARGVYEVVIDDLDASGGGFTWGEEQSTGGSDNPWDKRKTWTGVDFTQSTVTLKVEAKLSDTSDSLSVYGAFCEVFGA